MTFLIILLIVVVLGGAWIFRVPLLAKILGQPRSRIERHFGSKRKQLR
ncbi:MAG: hypothetical protein QM638_05580 [Nocardioides sp.]